MYGFLLGNGCLNHTVSQKSKHMTEIFRNRDSATMGHLQSLLEAEGIKTYIRSEHAATTTFPVVTPALCIIEDADVERGVELIRAYLQSASENPIEEQDCPQCGEKSPGSFATCWNCESFLIPSV